MVRQRTKRWGFDLGGEYILGIAKQEDYGEESLIEKTKAKPKKQPIRKLKKKPEDYIKMINPWR